jgi:hypothetical protein
MIDMLLADGRVVLAAIVLVLAELALCIALLRRRRRPLLVQFMLNGFAGLALMIALYAAVAGFSPAIMLAALSMSLLAHGAAVVHLLGDHA